MDSLSKNILIVLQQGSMCGPKISEVAKKLGKSTTTVYRKIKEMEAKGIIQGYVARTDPEKLGKRLTSLVSVQIEYPSAKKMTHEEFLKDYIDYFSKLKEVQEIYIPLGRWDVVMKVKTKDMANQYRFISERIMPIGNIRRMESIVMMKTIKETSYVEPE